MFRSVALGQGSLKRSPMRHFSLLSSTTDHNHDCVHQPTVMSRSIACPVLTHEFGTSCRRVRVWTHPFVTFPKKTRFLLNHRRSHVSSINIVKQVIPHTRAPSSCRIYPPAGLKRLHPPLGGSENKDRINEADVWSVVHDWYQSQSNSKMKKGVHWWTVHPSSPLFLDSMKSSVLSLSLLQNEAVLPYADANAMQTIFVVSNAHNPELSPRTQQSLKALSGVSIARLVVSSRGVLRSR